MIDHYATPIMSRGVREYLRRERATMLAIIRGQREFHRIDQPGLRRVVDVSTIYEYHGDIVATCHAYQDDGTEDTGGRCVRMPLGDLVPWRGEK